MLGRGKYKATNFCLILRIMCRQPLTWAAVINHFHLHLHLHWMYSVHVLCSSSMVYSLRMHTPAYIRNQLVATLIEN